MSTCKPIMILRNHRPSFGVHVYSQKLFARRRTNLEIVESTTLLRLVFNTAAVRLRRTRKQQSGVDPMLPGVRLSYDSAMPTFLCLFAMSLLIVLSGCASSHASPPATAASGKRNFVIETRNNSVSLLHRLLSEEQHVSKLLIIKRDRKELGELIKQISTTAGDGVKMIEDFAKTDRTLNLKAISLPSGEQAARDLQSSATTKDLLHSKGEDFEFKLLMTQAQALGYANSLAQVAAANEPNANRRKQFQALSQQLAQRHEQVIRLLRQ